MKFRKASAAPLGTANEHRSRWVDLLQLPPLPWDSEQKARDAEQRLQVLTTSITHVDATQFDRFLLWFYSECYLPLKSAFRNKGSKDYGASDGITIVCPGNGMLYPRQILKSGLLNDPTIRERALTLFSAANRRLNLDLWSFHVPDATPESDSFCAELFKSGATNAERVAVTRRLHPPISKAYHFAAGPHAVLSLLDQVLRMDYMLKGRQRPVCFLTISSGIFAALYSCLDVPFEEVCHFIAVELVPIMHDFETELTLKFLFQECGVPRDCEAAALDGTLLKSCLPRMLGVYGLNESRLNELLAACNEEFGTRIEIGVRMSPLLHAAVGPLPHLHALTAFIRARRGWFGSGCMPMQFKLLPLTQGSHHSVNQPMRKRVAPHLTRLLSQHPGDRLRYSIFHTLPGKEPALYDTVEELYEGVLQIIDTPVDFPSSLRDAFRIGNRKLVVNSSGASGFVGRVMRANIVDICQAFNLPGIEVYALDGLDELKTLSGVLFQ